MMLRPIWGTTALLCALAVAACAVPPAAHPPTGVPPVTGPRDATLPEAPAAPIGPDIPPPAEELESFALVRDEPWMAVATADLAAAPAPSRPAALMRRAREAVVAARSLRMKNGAPFGFTGWPMDHDRFIAYCELALRDLDELLASFPQASEAPEAMFTVGQVHDYPLLNLFDEALTAYRLTVERYPATPWAGRARERIVVIEGVINAGQGGHHGEPHLQPEPGRTSP